MEIGDHASDDLVIIAGSDNDVRGSGEFTAAHQAWEGCRRQQWEQARMVGWCAAAPHMSRRMSPAEFLPLPWDGERDGAADARDVEPAEESAADFDSRMDAAIRRWGLR